MEDLFFECESAYEGSIQHVNMSLESAIFTYTENLFTNHYVTESVKSSLWTELKQFFTKIILSMKDFIKELQLETNNIILFLEIEKA